MIRNFLLSLAACSLVCVHDASLKAAALRVVGNSNDSKSLYLSGGQTVFDGFSVSVDVQCPCGLENHDDGWNGFVPRGPGEPFTYVNQLLAASPAQGGKGLVVVDVIQEPTLLAFTAGSLSGPIQTGDSSFLANFVLDGIVPTIVTVDLRQGGILVERLMSVFPLSPAPCPCLPEPAALTLAGLAMSGVALLGRRRTGLA